MPLYLRTVFLVLCALVTLPASRAQFLDAFDGDKLEGWFSMTGDGSATMELVPQKGHVRFVADATQDRYNVWWTLMKRDVAPFLDVAKLKLPGYELRVEARIRVSHAPRRVNFMINTQRTTDFHEHLREFDIADTSGWHVISMTTKNFDPEPGDNVFVQFAATDWGPGQYHVDIDYYRADVVRPEEAGPDQGEPLMYHPAVRSPETFAHHLIVAHDTVVRPDFPDVNFNDWQAEDAAEAARILTVDAAQSVVLRWDFGALRGQKVDGAGVLELTTRSVAKGGNYVAHLGEDLGVEFGKVRVVEILGGDPAWDQASVSYRSLLGGAKAEEVFNSQMIFDTEIAGKPGAKTYVTLPRPVMQRLLDGRTKGLLLRPLGAISASVYASEDREGRGAQLHFSTQPSPSSR